MLSSVVKTEYHAIRCMGEWKYSSTRFLFLVLDGGEWPTLHFTLRKEPPPPTL